MQQLLSRFWYLQSCHNLLQLSHWTKQRYLLLQRLYINQLIPEKLFFLLLHFDKLIVIILKVIADDKTDLLVLLWVLHELLTILLYHFAELEDLHAYGVQTRGIAVYLYTCHHLVCTISQTSDWIRDCRGRKRKRVLFYRLKMFKTRTIDRLGRIWRCRQIYICIKFSLFSWSSRFDLNSLLFLIRIWFLLFFLLDRLNLFYFFLLDWLNLFYFFDWLNLFYFFLLDWLNLLCFFLLDWLNLLCFFLLDWLNLLCFLLRSWLRNLNL